MRLDDLGKRENLSTEEIIQVTSKLTNGDLLWCRVPITPAIKLVVYLNNKAEDQGWRGTAIEVRNRAYMRGCLYVPIRHSFIQNAYIAGGDPMDACLSVNDIVNIFELDDSVRWQILGLFDREESVEKPDWM